MKTKLINTVLFSLLLVGKIFGQDVTTVRANSSDISDNLDLQAVASIFGDSQDLEDFERRLNDPDAQISNLDLNGDNQVDYLRVIEVTEKNTHVIILQSVLAVDTYQDVATIEVERDRNNKVSVQVVGDSYIYGNNYIYEPVYVTQPAMFNIFWASSYRPYYSPWYYGYYPTYYNYWAPYPPYRYRYHVHNHINYRNTYNYVNVRNSRRAQSLYNTRSANAYARQNPNQSFTSRNANVTNRHQLEQTRSNTTGTRGAVRNTAIRNGGSLPGRSTSIRNNGTGTTRNSTTPSVRNNGATVTPRNNSETVRSTTPATPRSNSGNSNTVRYQNSQSAPAAIRSTGTAPSRMNSSPTPVRSAPVQSAPVRSAPIQSAPAVRSTPAAAPVRSMQQAPAPQRQSAPAAAPRNAGGSGGRRS